MAANPPSVRLLALELIEQCRRDISAGWEQVEAGQRLLDRSAWLLQRWAELARRAQMARQPYQPRLAGTFEAVETPRERLKPRRIARMRRQGLLAQWRAARGTKQVRAKLLRKSALAEGNAGRAAVLIGRRRRVGGGAAPAGSCGRRLEGPTRAKADITRRFH